MLDTDVKNCVTLICRNLPVLRKMLCMSQVELATICGMSRQTILQFEHEQAKVTRPILISLVTYFSLQSKTAQYLNTLGLYKNKYVQDFGFTEQVISYLIGNNINGK
jgi:DNA-binding XRE family transcriptional regulator